MIVVLVALVVGFFLGTVLDWRLSRRLLAQAEAACDMADEANAVADEKRAQAERDTAALDQRLIDLANREAAVRAEAARQSFILSSGIALGRTLAEIDSLPTIQPSATGSSETEQ